MRYFKRAVSLEDILKRVLVPPSDFYFVWWLGKEISEEKVVFNVFEKSWDNYTHFSKWDDHWLEIDEQEFNELYAKVLLEFL